VPSFDCVVVVVLVASPGGVDGGTSAGDEYSLVEL
jgi:hypothetical protein